MSPNRQEQTQVYKLSHSTFPPNTQNQRAKVWSETHQNRAQGANCSPSWFGIGLVLVFHPMGWRCNPRNCVFKRLQRTTPVTARSQSMLATHLNQKVGSRSHGMDLDPTKTATRDASRIDLCHDLAQLCARAILRAVRPKKQTTWVLICLAGGGGEQQG